VGLSLNTRIRINRAELSGAFGDIGTDLPLLTGMLLVSGMHPASVLTAVGPTVSYTCSQLPAGSLNVEGADA